jgi:ADP-heptose:LPS heptosyltransferase
MSHKKTLFIRVDRLGDLLVTLPVDELVSDRSIYWCIPKGLGFLMESREPTRSYHEMSRAFSKDNFLSFYKFLKKQKFDEAVVFHDSFWLALETPSESPTHGYTPIDRAITD